MDESLVQSLGDMTSIVEKVLHFRGGGRQYDVTALISFVIRFIPLKQWNLLCTIFHCCITSMIIFSDVIL